MSAFDDMVALVADRVSGLPKPRFRNLVAIAGPPASGKSTIAQAVCEALDAKGVATGLVAMDGFHLDNAILERKGLLARKGAPETFDLQGFSALLERLLIEPEVYTPTFDRQRDASIGSSSVITPAMKTVVVEGNYLLLDEPGWRDLHRKWALSIRLSVPEKVLEERLVQRWLDFGLSRDDAKSRANENDLPNAKRVQRYAIEADQTFTSS